MSRIIIDNPWYLLVLADQMNGFENAFGTFIENIRTAVQTTMDQLQKMIIALEEKMVLLSDEIAGLSRQLDNCAEQDDLTRDQLSREIETIEMEIYRIEKKKEKCEAMRSKIDYHYKIELKKYEKCVLEYISKYPKAIEALQHMEYLMKKYLTFSSELVQTRLTGNYAGIKPDPSVINREEYHYYEEMKESNNQNTLHKISFGRLKNLATLTDQILWAAELQAQNKKAKYLQFEIGDNDLKLCQRSGYKIFDHQNKKYAVKDLHNEIDLEGGFFKDGFLYKNSQKYKLD